MTLGSRSRAVSPILGLGYGGGPSPPSRPLHQDCFKEIFMHRYPVNKGKSAHKFKSNVGRTKSINMKGAPMRGGIRL